MKNKLLRLVTLLFMHSIAMHINAQQLYHEQYRPQIHFSPRAHWMNDPNGMVYNDGAYHLFFQYYPGATVWGPMHWGHAVSKDLIHWKEQPVALYPDSIGYIFSGSAVVDKNNTSGFGKNGKAPLVAIFTQHDPVGEKAGANNFQNQSIAYSLDNGNTWIKYKGNPVIKNPGITDFRDPKVMWYEEEKKWVMILAVKDHVSFYSSADLKEWNKESDFGKDVGAHGGVWECPDLFTLNDNGKKIWIVSVSINPGAPNGGSGTQYFTGNFNGKTFTTSDTTTKWIDYGPDDYAGVTWSNTDDKKIFLGWMSNWNYADKVPTKNWRSAMTIPRTLSIKHVGENMFLASEPVTALNKIETKPVILKDVQAFNHFNLASKIGSVQFPCYIKIHLKQHESFSFMLSNDVDERLVIGYDKNSNQYFIDRTHSGKAGFGKSFAAKHVAPRLSEADSMNISLVIDESSVELFADSGLSVMTEIFFPSQPYKKISIECADKMMFTKIEYAGLNGIW